MNAEQIERLQALKGKRLSGFGDLDLGWDVTILDVEFVPDGALFEKGESYRTDAFITFGQKGTQEENPLEDVVLGKAGCSLNDELYPFLYLETAPVIGGTTLKVFFQIVKNTKDEVKIKYRTTY